MPSVSPSSNMLSSIGTFAKTHWVLSSLSTYVIYKAQIEPVINSITGQKFNLDIISPAIDLIIRKIFPIFITQAPSAVISVFQASIASVRESLPSPAPSSLSTKKSPLEPHFTFEKQWQKLSQSAECIHDSTCVQGPPNSPSSFTNFILPLTFLAGTLWISTYAYQRYLNESIKKPSKAEQDTIKNKK